MEDNKSLDAIEKLSSELMPKVEELSTEAKEAIKTAKANEEALSDLRKANEAQEEKIGIQGAKITELSQFLKFNHGKSGVQDFNNLFGKFVKGCWEHKRYGQVSDENQIEGYEYGQKALDTTTDASAGYLVPDIMAATLYAAKDIYGTISPLMAKMTVPAGQSALINRENAKPVAQYRVAGQNEAIPTTDPTYAQDTVTPMLIGSLITVSNELLEAPGVNYLGTVAPQMLRAIVVEEEDSFLNGQEAATQTSPSDGIIIEAGVDVGAAVIGGNDLTDWLSFISEACAGNQHLYRPTESVIITTPAKVYALAASAVGTNVGQALSWADPVNGVPGRIIGYPFIGHPGAYTTKDWAVMFNPAHFLIANSGKMAVDVNPLGSGFKTNSSDIRVFTHTDFSMNNPAWYFRNSWA
jgi:HK97 family phage major capsid protein